MGGKWPYSCCLVECYFHDLCNITKVMINYINHFSLIIFDYLFWLSFELLGVSWFRCHNQTGHSHARAERTWQSVIINSQTGNGLDGLSEWIEWVDDVTPRRDGLIILGFWKIQGVEVQPSKRVVEFFRSDQIRLGLNRQGWVGILDITRCAACVCVWWGGDQHSRVSISPNELCLSPCVAKGWRQKEINPFISGTTVHPYYYY